VPEAVSRRRASLAFLLTLTLAAPAAGAAHDLQGTVQLLAKGGKTLDRAADVRHAVVAFRPQSPPREPAAGRVYTMATQKKEFVPRVLVVPVGSTVAFPNGDPILHNVFSVSGENRFDLGLYRQGAGKSWTFERPGLVRVFCNVHHSMVAYIQVLDTPYFAQPDASGAFTIAGAPAGPGTLEVWHEQAEPLSQPLAVPAEETVVARLEVIKPRLPAHLNKLGKPYTQRGEY